MFKKKSLKDQQILVLVRLLNASKKVLVFLALFGQLWSMVPWSAFQVQASTIPDQGLVSDQKSMEEYPTTTDANFDQSQVAIESEMIGERTANTKTFRKVDGTYEVAMYNDVIHYQKDGKWNDIDNSLFDSGTELETKDNQFKIKFPKTINENKQIKLDIDDYSINWNVFNIDSSNVSYNQHKASATSIKELTTINQSVIYNNVRPFTDIEYIVTGSKVKENIILNRYVSDFSMTFEYKLKGLSMIENKEGKIVFVNDKNEEIFIFSDMIMSDKHLNESTDIDFKLIETGNKTYQITIIPNEKWLEEASYPVVIDPTIQSSTQSMLIYDTYVSEAYPTSSYSTSTLMKVSSSSYLTEFQGLLYFYLPNQIMDKEITYSTMKLSKYSGVNDRIIGVYKNNTNFSSNTVNWSNKPSTSAAMTDYHVVDDSETYVFDITKTVREWQATGNTRTTGFTIRDKYYYGTDNIVKSKDFTGTTYDPVIEIGYIDPAGIKDYWTYNSQSTGEHSTGYVSDFTGLLNIVRNDLTYATERQTLSLGFAYNISDKNINYGYNKGWNIIYNSTVHYDSYTGLYYSKDATGNIVYYHQTTCDSRFVSSYPVVYTCHIAEDGSRNTLVTSTVYGNLSYYIYTGNEVRQTYNSSGYLTSIKNEKTNQIISITRDTTYPDRVTRITDHAGNKIDITYTNGYMTKAQLFVYQDGSTNPYLLEEVNYSYTFKGDGTGNYELQVEYRKNYEDTMSMATDDILKYEYTPSGRIVSSYLDYQDKVVYSYNTANDKITSIDSYYGSSHFYETTYNYALRETTITNQNGDFINYKFDNFGHTVNILDNKGNVQFYKYLNIFSVKNELHANYYMINGEPNYYQNHQLISQSTPQSNLFNPINNSGFEYPGINESVNWKYYNDTGDIRELDRPVQSDREALYGSFSSMINATSNDTGHFEQTVILDIATYTLTGYVKNEALSNNVWIDIDGEDYGGVITYVSPNNEWTKVTIIFGVTSNNSEITISLVNHAIGRAFFDNIEIYEGFVDNRTNMIDNPSFEMTDSSNNLPGWFFSDYNVYRTNIEYMLDDLHQDILGDYAIKIQGTGLESSSAVTGISDFLDTTILHEKGQLVIGAWANSEGTPTSITNEDYYYGNDRYFRIRVDFVSSVAYVFGPDYQDTIIKSEYVDFDTSIEGWQYQYNKVTMPDEDTYFINVFFEYKGEGSVYFDGLQVFFENSYTNYEYESLYGNLTAIQTSSGDRTEYTYDDTKDYPSSPEEILLPDDTTVELSTDSEERTSEVTYNNVSSTPIYNNYGQVDYLLVGGSNVYFNTSTTYTHLSQFISTKTNEYGDTTEYYYNTLNGLLEAIENAKGQDSHYIYDNEGKLIKVVSVENYESYLSGDEDALVEYMYDSKDRLWKIILGTNYYYEISYDSQGRMNSVSVNNQPLMSYSFEMDGAYYTNRLSEQTYGNLDVVKFNYNDKDQVSLIQFKESGGVFTNRFSYEYDQNGRITVYNTIENGVISTSEYYTYDASGNLIQAVDNEGNIIKYLYDGSGNLTSLYFEIDGNSSATNYTYNECFLYSGDTCIETSSLYDKTSYTSQSNNQITKDYHYETSALYRLESIKLSWNIFNIQQNFVFSGNTTRIDEITYEVKDTDPDNDFDYTYTYTYTYDSLGNITSESYYEDGEIKIFKNYEYDELNQLIVENSMDDDYPPTTLSDTNFTKFYDYDKRGNIIDIKTFLYGQTETTSESPYSFRQENFDQEWIEVRYNSSYFYDDIYNLNIGQTPTLNFEFCLWQEQGPYFSLPAFMYYDNLDINTEGFYKRSYYVMEQGIWYEFDIIFKVGNPTVLVTPQEHVHYNYDTSWQDQLVSYGKIEYIDGDPQTEVGIQSYTYDAQGNPTMITNFYFEEVLFDHAVLDWSGRELSSITIYEAYNPTPLYTVSYKYNDQGYRISKKIETASPVIETIEYTLIDDKVIFESNGTYAILYTYDYDGTLIGFSYDPNVNISNNEEDYFYLRNLQGDITHIINASGTTVVHYVYDAYGNITKREVTSGYGYIANINSYTYRGYRYDSEINMYYLNSRYYNPKVGRFINSDGLLGETGKILNTNMYAYGLNNPIMMSDDSGYMPKWVKKVGIAAIVAVVVVATVAVTVSTAGLGTTLIAGSIYGASSAGGQMLSNYKHGEEDIMKNVAGAFVGGFISGATLASPIGQISAGFINATINEVENEWLYDNDPEAFNLEDVLYEGAIYSAANIITSTIPNKKLAQDLALLIDYLAFDLSDTHKEDVTSRLTN